MGFHGLLYNVDKKNIDTAMEYFEQDWKCWELFMHFVIIRFYVQGSL